MISRTDHPNYCGEEGYSSSSRGQNTPGGETRMEYEDNESEFEEFSLHIELGNDAMSDLKEVAAAVYKVSESLEMGTVDGVIRDANGNTVGTWELT